jgi:predicted membrane chloride channel (bestrophin family)
MTPSPVDLLRQAVHQIQYMEPEHAREVYELVLESHLECVRAANRRLSDRVQELETQLAEALSPDVVSTNNIPREIVSLLDERAGKEHSLDGDVMATLLQILNRWERIRCAMRK